MRFRLITLFAFGCLSSVHAQSPAPRSSTSLAAHVAVISIDGLGAVEYLDPARCPGERRTLAALMGSGVYARGVAGVLPSVTYPAHATIVTGVAPARHGVLTNGRPRDRAPWHFDRSDIHAQTLWDRAHLAGLPVAIVTWPSTNGAEATWLIPENLSSVPHVATLVRNASTPGLFDRLEAATQPVHLLPFDDPDAGGPLDRMTTSFAAEIVRRHKPALLLMHLLDFDHREHSAGPQSPAACRSLDQIDALVGEIVAAYRSAGLFDQTAFFIVSDHGFLPAHTQINLPALIGDAGIETRLGGGSAALYGTDDRLESVRARVAAKYRDQLRWLGRADAGAFGGFPDAGAVLCAKAGYLFGAPGGPDIMSPSTASARGVHGHCPDEPGIDASFIASGAGIRQTGATPRVRMIDVGPTIAAALGLTLPDAEGRPIEGVFRR